MMHNLVCTHNNAMWRVPVKYIVWCVTENKSHAFDLKRFVGVWDEEDFGSWANTVTECSSGHLGEHGVVAKGEKMYAQEGSGKSFLVIVTWDAKMCSDAVASCADGMKTLGIHLAEGPVVLFVDVSTGSCISRAV